MIEYKGTTPLLEAVVSNRTEAAQLLLEQGASLLYNGSPDARLLRWAIRNENGRLVRLLLAQSEAIGRGAEWGDTPLFQAASVGNLELARLFLERGADPLARDAHNRTALYVACVEEAEEKPGHLEVARLLLSLGVGVDDADTHGNTPLMVASLHRSAALLNLLLDAGANVNATNAPYMVTGFSPLGHAVAANNAANVELLLNRGANINATDSRGMTALLYAVNNKCRLMIELLLRRGANVNAADKQGKTALMIATQQGNMTVMRLLIASGADVNATTKQGKSVLSYATRGKTTRPRISAILQAAGA